MTKERLADKIEWEGGVLEAVEYGIKVSDLPDGVPEEIADAWGRLEMAAEDAQLVRGWLWSEGF